MGEVSGGAQGNQHPKTAPESPGLQLRIHSETDFMLFTLIPWSSDADAPPPLKCGEDAEGRSFTDSGAEK